MDLFLCLQFPRSDAKSHSRTHIESHLNLALRRLEATQHQVHELITVVKEQSQKIERQSQQIERQSQQIDQMISKDKEQTEQIERLISKDKEQLEKMERLMSSVEDQSQQIKRLMSKDEEQSEKMEEAISTVQGQPPQRERREPINQIFANPFKWEIKIANITLQGLVSIPFYLFERGYKYSLKISERTPFVRDVYIKVVPGEFDELLSWPCKEKIRVTWRYQGKPRESKSNVIDFDKDGEPCYRPLNDAHDTYRLVLFIAVLPLNWKENVLITVIRE